MSNIPSISEINPLVKNMDRENVKSKLNEVEKFVKILDEIESERHKIYNEFMEKINTNISERTVSLSFLQKNSDLIMKTLMKYCFPNNFGHVQLENCDIEAIHKENLAFIEQVKKRGGK